MSAYLCERHHIIYLVKAAVSGAIGSPAAFRYLYKGEWHSVATEMDQVRMANELLNENCASLMARYPDYFNKEEWPKPFTLDEIASMVWASFKPSQIVKSAHCFQYQSCEHCGWRESRAAAFLNSVCESAVREIPSVRNAEWGAPKPQTGLIELKFQ